MSFLVFCVVTAIVEVACYLPTPGSSMNLFGFRYVSRSLGFSMGWLYFYSLGILVPYEITAAGLVIDYWNSNVNIAVWITCMIVVIVALNALPVRFYGETEFWFASTKVIMMIGLLILSVILFFGGGPSKDRLGFRYWENPGAANTYLAGGDLGRFLALLSTFVLSAFPFTFAPELMIVTAGEMQSPRRNLPIAARRYIYRLVFFYLGSVLAIGVICPSNDPALTDGGAGAGSSAFVVGIRNAGISVLDSIVSLTVRCLQRKLTVADQWWHYPLCMVIGQLFPLPLQPVSLFSRTLRERPTYIQEMYQIWCPIYGCWLLVSILRARIPERRKFWRRCLQLV